MVSERQWVACRCERDWSCC